MKGILIILDGLADLPCPQLEGKTPLKAAHKPNLNYLASKAELGYMYPVKEDYAPESDAATLSIFSFNPFNFSRGWLEGIGFDLNPKRGDLVLRTNFSTITDLEDRKIVDRRAGRNLSTKEAEIMAKVLNSKVKLPCKFLFKPTIQHRGVLIFEGRFSDNITNTDPAYMTKGKFQARHNFKFSMPLDEEDNTKYSAEVVNDFVRQSFSILNYHTINQNRRKKGFLPANIILTRDAGTEMPKIKKFKKWAAFVYMPLELGISKALGMQTFSFKYPELKGYDVYKNLHTGLKKAAKLAAKTLKKQVNNFDYFYIHFKETDIPGHDNKPKEKKAMIEELDRYFFSSLVRILKKMQKKKRGFDIIITADHSTPCKLKSHSADPVPVLFYNTKENENNKKTEKKKNFSEDSARKGSLGKIYGKDLLKRAGLLK